MILYSELDTYVGIIHPPNNSNWEIRGHEHI